MVDRTLLLVDGSSYLYRAYHALPDLRGPGGVPTGAIQRRRLDDEAAARAVPGGARRLRLRRQGQDLPRRLVPRVQGDAHLDARRPGAADRADPSRRSSCSAGRCSRSPGIEADDAIGTISCMAAKGGFKVVISTGDKDLAQLVDANVTLINTMSNEKLDVEGVAAKFGVAAGADRRLPGPDRRLGRQHPRRRQGRPEDGGEVDRRARLARGRDRGGAADEGRRRREPEEGARLAAAGAPPRHRRHRLRPLGPRPRLARVRRARAARDRGRAAARLLRPLRLRLDEEGARDRARAEAAPRARRRPRRRGRRSMRPTRCPRRRSSSTTRR